MNAKVAAVLVILLAVLGGGAPLIRQQSGAQKLAAAESAKRAHFADAAMRSARSRSRGVA